MFARDEMDEILGELIPVMKKEFPRRPPSNENLYEFYMSRVRNNLHVVLCFSPVRLDIVVLFFFFFGCGLFLLTYDNIYTEMLKDRNTKFVKMVYIFTQS